MAEETNLHPDDARLEENQKLRHDVIKHLLTDGNGKRAIPNDADALQLVKGLLKDSDSSVFTKKRLTVDSANAENDRLAAELLDNMINRAKRTRRDDFVSGKGPDLNAGKLPDFSLTEGEISQVGDTVDLDQIMATGRATLKGVQED